jgi:acyl carrier protein
VLAAVPEEYPLTAVVHAAAVLEDAVISELTPEQLARVLRVKVGGARNLDELTRELDLSAFVLFSSAAGVCGIPGQGNYAPGNAFLDALASYRRGIGLPATSVDWGLWAGDGIADDRAAARSRRYGFRPMAPELAVTALGTALAHDDTQVMVCDADWASLATARPYPLLTELVAPNKPAGTGANAPLGPAPIVERLAEVSEAEQRRMLVRLVRIQVAAALGRSSAEAVDVDRGFRDQGFDSLTAIDLRNRLSAEISLPLPTTAIFDYPTPAALAEHLHAELLPTMGAAGTADAVLAEIDRLAAALATASWDERTREAADDRLRAMVANWDAAGRTGTAPLADGLSGASDDELIDFIGKELGIS